MQTINPLLKKANEALKKGSDNSLTEAGQKMPGAGKPPVVDHKGVNHKEVDHKAVDYNAPGYGYKKNRDSAPATGSSGEGVFEAGLIDAINQIFSEFAFAYHNQYHKAFPDNTSVTIAKEYWLSCLAEFSPLQITRAARKLVKSSEFLPTVSAVVKACQSGIDLFGLPDTRQAYLEACRAASPKSAQQWSHAAVYHAGKASDWFILATEPEAVAFPIFQYNYRQMCQRVMQGVSLEIEQPKALEQNPGKKLSAEERHQCLIKLRQETGI